MNKQAIAFFCLSVTFLAIAFARYFQTQVSLANFLIFFLFGVATGSFFAAGIAFLKKGNNQS
jgi:hypothetical protein